MSQIDSVSEIGRSRRRHFSQVFGAALAAGCVVLGLTGALPAWAAAPTLTVSPGTLIPNSTGNSLVFNYGAGRAVTGATLTITFPSGFSSPTGVTASNLTHCTKATPSSGSGRIVVKFSCAAGGTFRLRAPSEKAPATPGTYTFGVTVTGGQVASPPSISVTGSGPAAKLAITGFAAKTDSDVATSLTVSALDAFGNVATTYAGTVQLSSTDPQATLPPAYALGSGDAGTHTFTNVSMYTPGQQTVTASDSAHGFTASATTRVSPPSSVTVSPTNATIARNGTEQYAATVNYADGLSFSPDTHVIWSSNTPSVATINAAGLAAGGTAVGTANIFATLAGVFGSTGLTVTPASTTTQLASSSNPSVWSQPVTLTATVAANGAPGVPTGTVTFTDNGSTLATQTLSGGQATLSISSLALGTHPIVATYNGDANDLSSPSAQLSQVVNTEGTTTSLASDQTAGSSYGQAVTFTATVSSNPPGVDPPSGFVSFTDSGGHILASVAVSNGTASFDTANVSDQSLRVLPVGNDTITATFMPTNSKQASSQAQFVQSVGPVATSLSASSTGATTFGTAGALSVTISPDPAASAAAGATGTITVTDASSNVVGSATVSGATTTVVLSSTLPAGSDALTVSYSGDGNYQASTTSVSQSVSQYTPAVSDAVNTPGPYSVGEQIPVTVTVTGVAGVVPTGSVSWSDGVGDNFGPVTLSDGTASAMISFPVSGTYSVVATYTPDSDSPSYTGADDSPGVSITAN